MWTGVLDLLRRVMGPAVTAQLVGSRMWTRVLRPMWKGRYVVSNVELGSIRSRRYLTAWLWRRPSCCETDLSAATDANATGQVDVSEIGRMYPGLRLDDVVGGVFLEKDGQADPVRACVRTCMCVYMSAHEVFRVRMREYVRASVRA